MITTDIFIEYTVDRENNKLFTKGKYKGHLKDLNEYIDVYYPGRSISEVAYILFNKLTFIPKCRTCGKELTFHDFKHGYRTYCGKRCAAIDTAPEQKVENKEINKDEIIKHFTDGNGNYIEQRLVKSYLVRNGWYNGLINYYNDSDSCFETIYRIVNDIKVKPTCKTCGKRLTFNYGYPIFCSRACSNNDPGVLMKNSLGVSKALKQAYIDKGEEIKEKRYRTLKARYGIESCTPFDSSVFREKAIETIENRYGVKNILQLEENKKRSIEGNQNKSIQIRKDQGYDIQYLNCNGETKILLKNGCPIHGDLILDLSVFNNRTKEDRRMYTTLCPYCNPLRNPETTIETQIKNILDELNITYEQHNRKVVKPYELDFFIPEYKVGIECNGIYWHQGEANGKRLLTKYEKANENGVKLLYFWEDEIHNKSKIIKSYLMSLFGKNKVIFARKCFIKEIDSKTSKEFIDNNHLQGNINASIKLGLFYNDELVEVMTFGKLRKSLGTKSNEGEYELYRLCSKGGYTIAGGASKLLKYFIDKYAPEKIITYCSNDISSGNVYEKIGFTFIKECGQGYCYINLHTNQRVNRFTLRKDVVNDGSGRTEKEINTSNGWVRCYDTGNKKYELIVK